MRTRHSRSAVPAWGLGYPRMLRTPNFGTPRVPEVSHWHAMNSGVITDIGKEASIARSGSSDDETQPKFGPQFAPHGKRSPKRAPPRRSRVRPEVGPPPPGDLQVAYVSSHRNECAIGLRGIWHAGRFHRNSRRVRPRGWSDASMDSSNPANGWPGDTLAPQCDCNLRSSRAQFAEGANRVFKRQIDAL